MNRPNDAPTKARTHYLNHHSKFFTIKGKRLYLTILSLTVVLFLVVLATKTTFYFPGTTSSIWPNQMWNKLQLGMANSTNEINNGCICPVEMNMLYVGIDNPINVALPGVASSRVKVRMEGVDGEILESGGKYTARPKRSGMATIIASCYSDGREMHYKMDFRVRNLPKPEAKWGTVPNDGLPKPKAVIAAQSKIFCSMGESFAFDGIKFTVTSCQIILAPRRGDPYVQRLTGNTIPQNVKSRLLNAMSGDRIIVDMIKANGPGGEKPLSPILIEIR